MFTVQITHLYAWWRDQRHRRFCHVARLDFWPTLWHVSVCHMHDIQCMFLKWW